MKSNVKDMLSKWPSQISINLKGLFVKARDNGDGISIHSATLHPFRCDENSGVIFHALSLVGGVYHALEVPIGCVVIGPMEKWPSSILWMEKDEQQPSIHWGIFGC